MTKKFDFFNASEFLVRALVITLLLGLLSVQIFLTYEYFGIKGIFIEVTIIIFLLAIWFYGGYKND